MINKTAYLFSGGGFVLASRTIGSFLGALRTLNLIVAQRYWLDSGESQTPV